MLPLDSIWLLSLSMNTTPSRMCLWNEELVASANMLALILLEETKEKEELLLWHCLSGWYRMSKKATVLDHFQLLHSRLVCTSLKLNVLLLIFVTLLLRSYLVW
jgi:hypothetical protein